MNTKSLYIIAGCNGAGKTTVSFTILPDILHCDQFINADETPTTEISTQRSMIIRRSIWHYKTGTQRVPYEMVSR